MLQMLFPGRIFPVRNICIVTVESCSHFLVPVAYQADYRCQGETTEKASIGMACKWYPMYTLYALGLLAKPRTLAQQPE